MVLHIGNMEIPVYQQKLAEHNIHILNTQGEIYYIPMITRGNCVADGTETLFYTEQEINTCNEITLPPGCYRLEMRGGNGGTASDNHNNTHLATNVVYTLNLIDPMQITLFRGGDGITVPAKDETKIPRVNNGLDSFVIAGDKIMSAPGGQPAYGVYVHRYILDQRILSHYESRRLAKGVNNYVEWFTSPGGGDSPNGTAGLTDNTILTEHPELSVSTATNGTSERGGDAADMSLTTPDGITHTAKGGKGGETIKYTCNGHTVFSYGTGGFGALCAHNLLTNEYKCIDGTDGASGNSNNSETSYIKIYKL